MSRINPKKRKIQIKIREKRKAKLAKLRQRQAEAKSEMEQKKILEKARQVAPWLSEEEFLAALKRP